MLVYWGMFAVPAVLSFVEVPQGQRSRRVAGLVAFGLIVWVVMAFRETGGDYPQYLMMYEAMDGDTLSNALAFSDPAYGFLNWISSTLGLGLYGVNAFCALIFLIGLVRFARNEPRPLLVIAVAMPYLVIVVAIGYTRQGTAIGLILLAILYIRRLQPMRAAFFVALAALFHSTAAATMPLVYFAVQTRSGLARWVLRAALLATMAYAAWIILGAKADQFYAAYVDSSRYSSGGTLMRSVMNAGAALILVLYRKRWQAEFGDASFWLAFAIPALLLVPLSFGGSTAVDRMGLYLIPLQLVGFGRLPTFLGHGRQPGIAVAIVIACYATSLFVWMNLGNFAGDLWLPYRSALLGTIS